MNRLLILSTILISCTPLRRAEWHIVRANRLAPELFRTDTVTIITDTTRHDTVMVYRDSIEYITPQNDTIRITRMDSIVRISYRPVHDTLRVVVDRILRDPKDIERIRECEQHRCPRRIAWWRWFGLGALTMVFGVVLFRMIIN
jgi:hypothetical protein